MHRLQTTLLLTSHTDHAAYIFNDNAMVINVHTDLRCEHPQLFCIVHGVFMVMP